MLYKVKLIRVRFQQNTCKIQLIIFSEVIVQLHFLSTFFLLVVEAELISVLTCVAQKCSRWHTRVAAFSNIFLGIKKEAEIKKVLLEAPFFKN